MEWALLLMHSTLLCTIDWTPLCYALQLFLTENSVSHGVGPLIKGLHPTLHVLLSGLHPTPCATPYNYMYSLQRTLSAMEWALLLMDSTLLCTIEWTPPYPLCYALQLFLTANSVSHGEGPLIKGLHSTLYY